MNKVKKVLLPALLATAVAGVTGAVVSATPVKASANDGQIYASVSLTDGIVFNYFTPRTDDNAPTAVFNGAVDSMDTSVVGLPTTYYGTDMWVFQYDKVTPQLLGEKFTISIGGTPVLTDYSVEDYCLGLNAKTASELKCTQNEYDKTAVLVKDLLFYGEAAKAYTNQSYEIPADAVYGSTFNGATDNSQMGTITSANRQNFIKNATVEFDSQPAIKFGFILKAPEGVKAFVGEQELTLVKGEGNNYTAVYSGIMATKFDEQVTVTLKEGNTVVHTVTYGINDYVARVQDDSNSDMVTLAKALYNYGASADVVYAIPDYTPNGDGTHLASNATIKSTEDNFADYIEKNEAYELDLEKIAGWGAIGGGLSYTHGLTTDGEYIYAVQTGYASEARPTSVYRLAKDGATVTSATIDTFTTEKTAGISYYDGKIYIFGANGEVKSVAAQNFAAGVAFTDDTLTFSDSATIIDMYYDTVNKQFAVIDGSNNLCIYDQDKTLVKNVGSVGGLTRMTGTDKYIYVNQMADGSYTPNMKVYDWNGTQVGTIKLTANDTEMGFEVSKLNTSKSQGMVFMDGSFYFSNTKWKTGDGSAIIKVSGGADENCVHTGIGDKMGAAAVAGATTALDMKTTKDIGWKSFGSTYNHDMTSDGRYIYGISASGATARILHIYRYDTVTGNYVQGPNTGVGVSNEVEANITYHDGKVIVYYGTTGKLMAIDAETFGASSTFTEYTGISFTKDGSALNAWDFEQNKRTGQYVVNAGGTIYIFERDKTTYKSIGSATRITSNENYIFTLTKKDGTVSPSLQVYDWSGKALGTVVVPNSNEIMAVAGSGFNVQGMGFANGAFYFTMAKWSGKPTDGTEGGGVIMKAQIIDAEGTPCYYCNAVAPEYGNFTIVTAPTLTSGGLAVNEVGAQVTLPALSLDDYDIEGGSGSYTFTYKANPNIVFEATVPSVTVDGVVYDVFNLYDTDTMTSTYDGTKFVFTLNGNTTLSSFGAANKDINVVFGGAGTLTVNSNISLTALTIENGAGLTVNATSGDAVKVKNLVINGNITVAYATVVSSGTAINLLGGGSATLSETGRVTISNVPYGFTCWNAGGATLTVPTGCTLVNDVITMADGTALETYTNCNNKHNPVYPDGQDRGLCIRTEDGAFLQGATDPITDETKPAA